MHSQQLSSFKSSTPTALYSSQQFYAIEQSWFDKGYSSFALMQQAAWQMTQRIIQLDAQNDQQLANKDHGNLYGRRDKQATASIWVGRGNNGGDGWLIAYYLQQAGWQVQVTTVGIEQIADADFDAKSDNKSDNRPDVIQAQSMALAAHCPYQRFEDNQQQQNSNSYKNNALQADIYIDALFGIGLDRAPTGIYKQAIESFNKAAQQDQALVVAVDIPSGLVASTGQVFDNLAIQADVTLCLVARKFGLHTKDGMDYAGKVLDMPLIPFEAMQESAALLLKNAYSLTARQQNSYKGSYGNVLVIGGNQIDGSQGMGGASILASASAMAAGAGKITVACHHTFHGALLTSLPDAMTIDLHDQNGVKNLIKEASVIAIGMGLGRDDAAKSLFITYVQAAMEQEHAMVVDADGLYHLAALHSDNHKLIGELKKYSKTNQVCFTPHSGEAARLLDKKIAAVESDRLAAIKQCAATYGGDWVLKGTGSLVLEKDQVYVCDVGNPGMASAGMGDVLSGVAAGLFAQQDLDINQRSLCQAVLIHGLAGDTLVNQHSCQTQPNSPLYIGQRGLQAQDMPVAIRHVMHLLTL